MTQKMSLPCVHPHVCWRGPQHVAASMACLVPSSQKCCDDHNVDIAVSPCRSPQSVDATSVLASRPWPDVAASAGIDRCSLGKAKSLHRICKWIEAPEGAEAQEKGVNLSSEKSFLEINSFVHLPEPFKKESLAFACIGYNMTTNVWRMKMEKSVAWWVWCRKPAWKTGRAKLTCPKCPLHSARGWWQVPQTPAFVLLPIRVSKGPKTKGFSALISWALSVVKAF